MIYFVGDFVCLVRFVALACPPFHYISNYLHLFLYDCTVLITFSSQFSSVKDEEKAYFDCHFAGSESSKVAFWLDIL